MKEKRAAIITLYCEKNYGSVLQAYALKRFIDGIGNYNSEVLRINPNQYTTGFRLRRAMSEGGIRLVASKIIKKIYSKFFYNRNISLRNKILESSINNIASEKMYSNSDELISANDLYDIFVAGSDQIWGDSGSDLNAIYMYYLKGIKKPKISYAPSIGGGANFDRSLVHHIVPLLNEFKHISVRESEGKNFFQGILGDGKPVFQAIDPALLLSANEWDDELKKQDIAFKYENDKYIFVYLLGKSNEHRDFVRTFAKSKKMKIISFPYLQMHTKYDAKFADINIFDATPQECLLYIKNAAYVFTDSFHCTIFSGLFHKEFYVFKKENHGKNIFENQFARFEDLLELFTSRERYVPQLDINVAELDKITTDWNLLDTKLSVRRKECREWLQSALDSITNDEIAEDDRL